MEKETFAKYLKERYSDQVKYYDDKAGQHKKKYREFQWILIVLSALTPVLAALDGKKIFNQEVHLQIVVVTTSAIVAILTSGLKTFQYQELWTTYRLTQELLKPEYYYYQFNVGPYAETGIDKESLFVSRVESILDKEHAGWPPSKKSNDQGGNDHQATDAGAAAGKSDAGTIDAGNANATTTEAGAENETQAIAADTNANDASSTGSNPATTSAEGDTKE